MRAVLVLVALVVTPIGAGCFGGDGCAGCAQPTDHVAPPTPTAPSRTAPPNYNDPGYAMTEPWHVGDQWDYTSNLSNQRTMKVVERVNVSGQARWRILEVVTTHGATTRAFSWVLDGNYTRANLTADSGITQAYDPYAPVRFLRNATYAYNLTTVVPPEAPKVRTVSVKAQYVGQSIRVLPWGNALAGRVDENDKSGTSESTTIHWVSRDYANDVYFQVGSEEFRLVAAHVGDRFYAQENLRAV